MALNFLDTVRASTLVLAAGVLASGCGGGGGDAPPTASPSDVVATSAGATVAPQATGSTGAAGTDTTPPSGDSSTATTATTDGSASTAEDPVNVASASPPSNPPASGGSTPKSSQATRSSLGMNIGSLDYFSPVVPTIDLMKKASPWLTQCSSYVAGNACNSFAAGASAWDTLEEAKLDLDANGWVRTLPASNDATTKYRSIATMIFSGGWQQAGQYVVRYDGSGTLSYSGVGTRNAGKSTAGRDVVDVVNTNASALILAITATTPGNYIRNIRVYPPGGACATDLTTYAANAAACSGAFVAFENFPAGSTWHPALLTELKKMRTARFMDWQRTNSSPVTDWSQRTIATARSWNTAAGVPLEQIVSLANTANVDPWVNVPTHATDAYVVQFAQVLHQQLAANLVVNVEYSNETWNYAFPASHWIYDQAQAAWPAEVAAHTDPYLMQSNWYANRLVQVCNLIKGQFGADKARVRCVANTQAANPGSATNVLNCTVAAKTLGQPCAKSIDVLAIAPYFGGYISSAKLRPTVAGWYTQSDGGLSQLFNEIMGTEASASVTAPLAAAGSTVPGGSLAQSHGWMTANKAVADRFAIPMWAYEGGQSLTPPGGDTDTTLVNLFIAANRDPRMGAAYARMLADWQASGGQTFALYTDVGTPSKFGMWGLRENQFDTTAPKWAAMVKVRDTVACWWSGC